MRMKVECVPPQLWNKTVRKTRAKANEIRAPAGQLRSYGMVVGIVLYSGTKVLHFGDGFFAVPFGALGH